MCVVAFHIFILYGVQFEFFEEYILESNSSYSRYFGLTKIFETNCDNPTELVVKDVEWATFVNPLALIWLYYIVTMESKQLFKPQVQLFNFFNDKNQLFIDKNQFLTCTNQFLIFRNQFLISKNQLVTKLSSLLVKLNFLLLITQIVINSQTKF